MPPGFDGVDPVAEYDHTEGDRSLTGGFVYRGTQIPALVGHYVFGDWVSGRLFHLDPVTMQIQVISIDAGGNPGGRFIGFGETPAGELLALTADFGSTPPSRLIKITSGITVNFDADGDGIRDSIETFSLDSDGDGTPDYLDADSDNNGIPDLAETGDNNFPFDSDADGTADFRDTDNDNDGYSDAAEIGGDPANPLDLDNDGIPDHRDSDSLGIGDVNTDGAVTISDLLALQQALIEQIELDPAQTRQADIHPPNGDDVIDVSDLLLLQKIIGNP